MTTTLQGTQITMPKLGESVTEGTLGAWLKQVGERVDRFEPIVEVVTDKVTAEIPAPVSGTLVQIIGQEGETIPVGGLIAVIDEGGSTVAVPLAAAPAAVPPSAPDPAPVAATGNGARQSPFDERAARARRDEAELLRARSSPRVRRLAEEHDIDLREVRGSGIGGRVTKADIEAYIQAQASAQRQVQVPPAAPAHVVQPAPEPPPTIAPPFAAPVVLPPQGAAPSVALMPGDEVIEASVMRKAIAEHMVRSVQTAPHVTIWMDVDMSRVAAARDRHQAEFQAREGFELTWFPFLFRVAVQALAEHPQVNSVWDNGRIIRRKSINIGVAVALEDGLIVPVVKGADALNIVGIARAVRDLAQRARAGKLTPDDVSGGTFTLNNPGTLGTLFSTPIIVQPQAGILSMEAIVKRPVVVDDAIAIRPMMNMSFSIDHRILDGLAAARFLGTVKRNLEQFPVDGTL